MKHLEPVVKKSSSYSILFLRDDSGVVRFRLKPGSIKFLALLMVIFCGASGASGYAAHYYWKKYQALKLERITLTEKLGENRRQLGRFASMERIKESTLSRSTMAGINAIIGGQEGAENQENNGSTAGEASTVDRLDKGSGDTPPVNGSASNGNGAVSSNGSVGNGNGAAAVSNGLTSVNRVDPSPDNSASSATSPETPDSNVAPQLPDSAAAIPQPANEEHPALIEEVRISPLGGKSFRLSFDISNRDQQITLNGRVNLAVGTRDSLRHDVSQVSRDTLRFIINRYKRVNTSFSLPDNIESADVTRLFLTVVADEHSPATYAFPFP